MKLAAVTVCVDYADFLQEVLPRNKPLFDRLVVVTTKADEETQKVCEWEHIQCVQLTSAELGVGNGEFNKGRAINAGLEALGVGPGFDGWIVQLDADIAMPPQMRVVLEQTGLDPHYLYGCDRFLIDGYRAWRRFCRAPKLQHENGVYVHTDTFPIGTRFISKDYQGYIPIGFFQLWHPATSGVYGYPENHTNAGRSDMLFARNWARNQRELLPEIVAYHLESDAKAPQGANWSGRITARFAPRTRVCKWWHRWRHHRHHKHPYWEALL